MFPSSQRKKTMCLAIVMLQRFQKRRAEPKSVPPPPPQTRMSFLGEKFCICQEAVAIATKFGTREQFAAALLTKAHVSLLTRNYKVCLGSLKTQPRDYDENAPIEPLRPPPKKRIGQNRLKQVKQRYLGGKCQERKNPGIGKPRNPQNYPQTLRNK
eukprot:51188-Amphidinium_carterae.1